MLISNKDFVSLINPSPSSCDELDISDVLLGGEWYINGKTYTEQGHVFDYNFVDDTTSDNKTFVFVETDIDMIHQNAFMNFNLYVCIFASKDLVRITEHTTPSVDDIKEMGYFASNYANRIDILCDIADRVLNGNAAFPGIGTIKPSQRGFMNIYCPNSKYYGKILKYNITNYNEEEVPCENY